MADETVRIGIVGAGSNTRLRHIPGFKELEGVELVSVANRSRQSSQQVADEYEIPEVYDSWVDLIQAPNTNAICIGTWPYMHCTLVLAALKHDKHVLTEARMAMNTAESHIMLNASRKHPDRVSQIVPAPHTLKVDRIIKDLIANGYLGRILSVDLTWHQGGFIDYSSPMTWRLDRNFSGYNTMQMGIWYEAMMRWIGPATSVLSITKTNVTIRSDNNSDSHFITIPDHIEIICEMASGPLVHMRFSAVTGLAPTDQLWFFGTEGTLRLDVSTMRLYGGRRGEDQLSEIEVPVEKQGHWRVEEEFVNAIRGVEPVSLTTFEDGVRYMEFTEAVARSAQSGNKIHLPR